MKRLLLFLSLLSLIPGIKGQEFDPFGLGDNAILYQCHQCLQIFNTQNELDQHEIDHLLFAGLDIDDIDLSAFDKPPLSSFNNSVSAHPVFASPAAPAHASATAQGPVIDQRITKGSIEPQKNQLLLPIVKGAPKFFDLAPIIPADHEQPKSTTEEEFAQIAEGARAAGNHRRRAAIVAHKMITRNDISEEEEEEEEEETGNDESYSADPENKDNGQPIDSAKETTDETYFECSECKKTFTWGPDCLRHIRVTHQGNAKIIQLGIAKAHKCDFTGCTRSFDTEQSLINHRRKHNQQTSGATNKHVCPECGQSWQYPGLLEKHIAQKHSANRDYHCTFSGCEKSFAHEPALKLHQRIHLSNIECPICEKKCATKTMLKVHMRKHTGELPFKCPYPQCKKGFAQKGNLTTHIKMHHSD